MKFIKMYDGDLHYLIPASRVDFISVTDIPKSTKWEVHAFVYDDRCLEGDSMSTMTISIWDSYEEALWAMDELLEYLNK